MTRINDNVKHLTTFVHFLNEAPSGKAFQCCIIIEETGGEIRRDWFPHSQVKTPEGNRVTGGYREPVEISVPIWLADKVGLSELLREDALDTEYGEDEPEDAEGWGEGER